MLRSLPLQQLDKTLSPWRSLPRSRPSAGWLRAVRQALGMTTRQPTIHRAERHTAHAAIERRADHIAPTTFMKMPWLLKLMSVRSSEKFVKLYPSPAFTCLPKWR